MQNDSVRAFINGVVTPSESWWHANEAVWDAYMSYSKSVGVSGVAGGVNSLMKYLHHQLDFEIGDVRKTIGDEQIRGKTGLYVQGAPGIHLPSGVYFGRTHDGQPVLEIVDVDEAVMVTEECPVCGEQHRHGREPLLLGGKVEFSHRVAHCPTPDRPRGYFLTRGDE